MPVEIRVPANINFAPPFLGDVGTRVGGDDALVTSDGDASYLGVTQDGSDVRPGTAHTFTWEPSGPIPPDATVTVEADWWTPFQGGFSLAFAHPTMGNRSLGEYATPADVDTHDYGDVTVRTIAAIWVEDGEAFLPGVMWSISSLRAATGTPTVARVTRLTMRIEYGATEEPLRLRQRSDGLGLGSNRVRGVGSRQRSPRVRGYL